MPNYASLSATSENPLVSFAFRLEIEGVSESAFFSEVSGMGSENEIVEQKIVTSAGIEAVRKHSGRLKWGDITLKRGIGTSLTLVQWRKQIEEGGVGAARKNISIILMDSLMKDIVRWDVTNAWPSKISTGAVQADGNSVVMEEVTLVHEGIVRTT